MASEHVPNRYSLSIGSPEGHLKPNHFDFFDGERPARFPSPAEVRANPVLQGARNSLITKFASLNIVVKYGQEITVSEAYCLLALQLLPDVPVPKVYEWCEDGGEVFNLHGAYPRRNLGESVGDSLAGSEEEGLYPTTHDCGGFTQGAAGSK